MICWSKAGCLHAGDALLGGLGKPHSSMAQVATDLAAALAG